MNFVCDQLRLRFARHLKGIMPSHWMTLKRTINANTVASSPTLAATCPLPRLRHVLSASSTDNIIIRKTAIYRFSALCSFPGAERPVLQFRDEAYNGCIIKLLYGISVTHQWFLCYDRRNGLA